MFGGGFRDETAMPARAPPGDSRAVKSDSELTQCHSGQNDLFFQVPVFCYRPGPMPLAFGHPSMSLTVAPACADEFVLFSGVQPEPDTPRCPKEPRRESARRAARVPRARP